MLLNELHDFDQDPKQAAGNLVRQRAQQQSVPYRQPKRDDEPVNSVQLHFYQPGPDGLPDEDDTKLTVVEIDVEYDVTEDEYDGPHLFSRGGVDVDWHVAKSFVWNGHQLNKLLPQMAACCDELEGAGIDAFESGDSSKCMELLDQAVKSQLDLDSVKVPQRRYADSRSY